MLSDVLSYTHVFFRSECLNELMYICKITRTCRCLIIISAMIICILHVTNYWKCYYIINFTSASSPSVPDCFFGHSETGKKEDFLKGKAK